MLIGAADPLEGCVLILPGSGMVALGAWLGQAGSGWVRYWLWVFGLIAVGVAAMFVLGNLGGIGGRSGRSMWWGLLILPYPAGWLMALAGAITALVRSILNRKRLAQSQP